MIKRNFLIWFLALGLLFPLSSNATGQQIDWLPVSNCMSIASNLNSLLQNPTVVETSAVPFDETTVIDDWGVQDYSSSYFVDYNWKERLITLVMWPKDPKGSTVDFKYSKKIWKIKLPVGFDNIRTRVYDNKYLVIFAEHFDYNRRTETIGIFYEISDWKISPYYYFTHTWKIIKIHEQDGKLYVITNAPLDKSTAQSFIKKDGNLPSIFPVFSEWIKFWYEPQEKTSVCRDYRYLQMPSNQMPSFWSVIVLNMNNLKISKDILYLLWTVSEFEFTEKSMYTAVPWDWNTTIVQKFWLDPKINLQKSVQLDVPVVWGWIYAKDMRLAYVVKRNSWKINQYILLPFDSSFAPWAEKPLYTSEEDFTNVEFHSDSVILKNKEKLVKVWELSNWGITTHAWVEFPLKWHKYFMFWSSPFSIIDLSTDNSEIGFSLVAIDKTQWKTALLSKAKYSWKWELIGQPSWNLKTRTMLLPLKMSWDIQFEWIRALQLSNKWAISEVMARSYWDTTMVEKLIQLQDFSYAITNKLVDVFLPNNTISKKVFSR